MSLAKCVLALLFSIVLLSFAYGKEPSWTGVVVKRGVDRVITQQTPIEYRPYRPFHFYGNTVRRLHYRGEVLPRPKDAIQGTVAFLLARPINGEELFPGWGLQVLCDQMK